MGEQDIYVESTKGKEGAITILIHTKNAGNGKCEFIYDKEHKTVNMECTLPETWERHMVPLW